LTVFVDTSALLAVLDADELRHAEAAAIWQRLLAEDVALLSSNYILVETFALVQRRLGMEAVRTVENEMAPVLSLHWLDAELHRAASVVWLKANRRSLSLVDCTSFEVMHHRAVQQAFAFDGHFEEHGFEVLRA
jgi:uncharacterized protein